MGGQVSRNDWIWSYTAEPHATRRKEILAKYPQIKKLMGSDPNLKYQIMLVMALQMGLVYSVQFMSWPMVIFFTYTLGGLLNQSLCLGIHEVAHNLAFGHSRPLANKIFSLFANLPAGIPIAITFKKYHLTHHRYQGDVEFDGDLPTKFESRFFVNTATKLLWVLTMPFWFAVRPMLVYPTWPQLLEVVNVILQIGFDYLIYQYWGGKALFCLTMSKLYGISLHPAGGHAIAEHYQFQDDVETYSYYGPLNWFLFNIGYHNEHHDFPNIPGSRLPQLQEIAPEYYKTLPHHTSYCRVIYEFITNPKIGPFARTKRQGNRPQGEDLKVD
ncbi:sphingolipid delta(4)-desaturase DES1-like [Montipora foliosa]|uniref:sphingolipid delta(4)-desaturase DES1-like n=1 Tax=Montipora foliosa TaxID=591990 RepID=UPI0035F179D7